MRNGLGEWLLLAWWRVAVLRLPAYSPAKAVCLVRLGDHEDDTGSKAMNNKFTITKETSQEIEPNPVIL